MSPKRSTATPYVPKPSRTKMYVWPRLLWSHCFCSGLSTHETLCAPFNSGVSVFPSPMKFLISSPTGFQSQMIWGLPILMPDRHQEPDVGLRNFTPVRKFLHYNYFPVCVLPTWVVCGLIIFKLLPSYPFLCVCVCVCVCFVFRMYQKRYSTSCLFFIDCLVLIVICCSCGRRWVHGPFTTLFFKILFSKNVCVVFMFIYIIKSKYHFFTIINQWKIENVLNIVLFFIFIWNFIWNTTIIYG